MSKILIVEDDDLNLKLMNDILVAQGFDVESATDGESALQRINDVNYDLVLLDLQMPKLSGFDVLKELKKSNVMVKVIVVSACAMSSDIQKAKGLGCTDFITKPIRLNDFLSSVKGALIK